MDSEAAIIAQVIEHYGAYSASLEREYIRSQQRLGGQPDLRPTPRVESDTDCIRRYMRERPGRWWTAWDVARGTGRSVGVCRHRLNQLVYQEDVVRMFPPKHGQPSRFTVEQRYRWNRP